MKKLIIIIPSKKVRLYLKILVFLIPALLLSIYLASNTLSQNVISTSSPSSENEIDLLKAYEENDTERVRQYFENWNEESKELTKTVYTDELEENLYKIFRVMFYPYNMDPLVRESMMGYFEQDLIEVINRTPYFVVQNKLSYMILDFEDIIGQEQLPNLIFDRIKREDIKNLEEFYPLVDEDPEKVLYLMKIYEADLTLFLGTEDQPFGEKNIMGPSVPKGETGKRYQFIRNYIPILYGHWGGYWHLSTHPEIDFVFINPKLNHALAHYRIGYNFGLAELKKKNGDWVMINASMNGIE